MIFESEPPTLWDLDMALIDFFSEKSKKFGKVEAFYCGGIDEGKWFDKGELKIEILDRNTQIGNLKISGTEIRNMIKNNDNLWKNYVPQQNINFIENYIVKNKNN